MKRFVFVLISVVVMCSLCVPFAFASAYTASNDTGLMLSDSDPLVPDTDLEGGIDQEQFEEMIGNAPVSLQVYEVFNAFKEVWSVIPAAIRFTIIIGFTVACILAIFKMLF